MLLPPVSLDARSNFIIIRRRKDLPFQDASGVRAVPAGRLLRQLFENFDTILLQTSRLDIRQTMLITEDFSAVKTHVGSDERLHRRPRRDKRVITGADLTPCWKALYLAVDAVRCICYVTLDKYRFPR